MNIENNIDKIIDDLLKSGSEIDYLKELRNQSIDIVKKDLDIRDVLKGITIEIEEQTNEFLNGKNNNGINYISGISSCIYFPDFNNNGECKLKLLGGNISRNENIRINENTMFDVASITKLYTLILFFKLTELGLINLNDKVNDVNPDIKGLEDFTFEDLIRLHGELRTNGNITSAKSQEEAYEILKTLYLSSNSRTQNKYTDFGAIIISDSIEKVLSKWFGKKISFEEVMNMYLLKPLGLDKTVFNPQTLNVSGNGNNLGLVHDPKARILGGALGHAGIFTTSDDLAKLAKSLYSVNYISRGLINRKNLAKLGEITFPNSNQSNKGNLGIYVKHPLGYEKTFTPPEFSLGSFSHQGWTGSVATFDPNNLIHQNILVNAIYNDDNKQLIRNDKPVGFGIAFEEYQKQITRNTMLMYIAKKYYNMYCNVKENINVTKYI